jgi:hypothetical protein
MSNSWEISLSLETACVIKEVSFVIGLSLQCSLFDAGSAGTCPKRSSQECVQVSATTGD